MLQITSINKETAIAPELVQNGDFSEISTTNLVTNGNFSVGIEKLTNGDFSDGSTDWIFNTGWSLGTDKAIWDANSATQNENINQSISFGVNKSYKVTFTIGDVVGSPVRVLMRATGATFQDITDSWEDLTAGTYTRYFHSLYANTQFDISGRYADTGDSFSITDISLKELGEGWTTVTDTGSVTFANNQVQIISDGSAATGITQNILSLGKSYKVVIDVASITGKFKILLGTLLTEVNSSGVQTFYGVAAGATFYIYRVSGESVDVVINSVTVQELDPDEDWILSQSTLSIGENKGIFTNTTVGHNFNQQKFTIEDNVSYRASFDLVDYTAGSLTWYTTGGALPISLVYSANETGITFDFIGDVEGGTPGIKLVSANPVESANFAVTNISVKKLAAYLDQSIYVTAADVQTIAQPIVSYLVELTSMSSKNSIYFIPSSITPNNGRYTKMNFTVVSKDGIISFYDSVGGEDTYPMGFYEFKIYEQTSPTNLDPTLATKLLEKGTVFVQNISGNTSEITSEFNEYDPTLTQYVYSQ